jgi:hypothetical protein
VANLSSQVDYRQISLSWDDSGAESYRITRSDGVVCTSVSAGFVDSSFPRGRPISYRVAAVGWDGTASAPVSIEVSPQAELKPPATPPLPDVYLDALNPKVLQNGWGKAALNRSVAGKPLSVAGKEYPKGMGVHARSTVVCRIPARATRFVAVAGLDDAKLADPRSSVTFEVYGDVKEMGEQPVLLGQSPMLSSQTLRWWNFNVELNSRFKDLRLVVTDAGDGVAADHADWVQAGFVIAKDR